jgi:hypothetical protein
MTAATDPAVKCRSSRPYEANAQVQAFNPLLQLASEAERSGAMPLQTNSPNERPSC